MFEKWAHKIEEKVISVSNKRYTPGLFSFEMILVGVSLAYQAGVHLRLWLYQKGLLKQKTLPCFVISVGNIVVGGTGKTPMAVYLAERLRKMGKKPVVISRGYRGDYKKDCLIVSDGKNILSTAAESGDEPFMMAKRNTFPVVIGKDRFTAGCMAIKSFHPDVIILDDGFQHLKLKRDMDLLLLDYENPFGNERFLPAGRLREAPEISSQRTDAVILTRCPQKDENKTLLSRIKQIFTNHPCFRTQHVPYICQHVSQMTSVSTAQMTLQDLEGKNAILFSGIAKNASFYNAMKGLGVNILDHLEFKDHYRYKGSDILRINKTAQAVNADVILTTEKDWVKISRDMEWKKDVIVMGVNLQFKDQYRFETFLKSKLDIV